MSNSIAPGSSADVNVKVTALTTNPNVPVTYKTIILKKNLVNGVNTLTQEMISIANTKYVIKYNYVLGNDITVPENCILGFDGGSISVSGNNYTITGINTSIQAGLIKIFNTDVTLAGSWNIVEAYPEWFGAVKDDNTIDSRVAIQKCINSFAICVLSGKYYLLSNSNGIGIRMIPASTIRSNYPSRMRNINGSNRCGIVASSNSGITTILVLNWSTTIESICVYGWHVDDWYSNTNDLIGIGTENDSYISRISIIDTEVSYCKYGIKAIIYLTKLDGVICSCNYGGIYIYGTDASTTSLYLTNCYVSNSVEFGYKFYKVVYSSLISCACDNFGIEAKPSEVSAAYTFLNCEGMSVISCGVEQAYRALYSLICISLIVEGCNFSTNYTNSGIDHNNWIFFKNATSCIFNSYIFIHTTPENWNGKYFLVEDYRNNMDAITIQQVGYNAISYSFTGSDGNVNGVKKEVKVIGTPVAETEITENTLIESIVNYNPCIEFTRRFFISVSTTCQMIFNIGNTFVDNFGCQTLIFEGHDFENSLFRVDVGYISPTFKNYKKIIFKNIMLSWVDGKSIPGVNFIDTDVTFINCKINAISGHFPIKATNSKIEFINTFIMGESQNDRDFTITGYCNSIIRTIYSSINEGIPEGVEIIYSNGKRAKVINSVGCNAPMNMSATNLTALKALTSGLQSYEKEMLEGSIGTVTDTHKTYTFTNSNWYNPDGSLA